jgi:hypothetical protein
MAEPNTPDIVSELTDLRKPVQAFTVPQPKELTGLQTQMGKGVPGVPEDYSKAVFKIKSSREVLPQQAQLMQQKTAIEQDIGAAQQAKEEYGAQAKYDIARQEREAAQGIEANLEATRKKFPYPEFHPTKDNIQSLSTIFGLIGVVGMALGGAGKSSATLALNSMGGMMKGWQQGRSDLWKKEKEEFDKNMAKVKAVLEDAYKDADRAMKTLAYNRQEAEALAGQSAAKLGGQVLRQVLNKQGVENYVKVLDNVYNDYKAVEKQLADERRHQETLASQERLRKATLEAAQGRRDIKSLEAIGPALRNIAENYPDGTANQLVGASPDDKRRVQGSYRAIEESENAADFIAKNRGAVGALAVAKNFLRIDAINSIKNDDEAIAASAKQAAMDQQIDQAAAKGQISAQDAQNAKILQKKLFGLALADVQSSGQRGSVYLDRQFQNLYDQASKQDTLLKIIKERAEENNRNLKPYKLNIERHNNPELFPLAESKDVNTYIKERAPAGAPSVQPKAEHIRLLRDNQDPQTKAFFDEAYGPGAADKVLWGE